MARRPQPQAVSEIRSDAFLRRFDHYDRRADWRGFFAIVGSLAVSFPLIVVVIGAVVEIFGSFFAQNWQLVIATGIVGALLLAVSAGVFYGLTYGADPEGILLLIDEAGVYLGGRRPLRLPWTTVTEVHLIIWTTRETRVAEPVSYSAAFRISDTGRRTQAKRVQDEEDLEAIRTVVHRHAPTVPVFTRTRQAR